MALLSVGSGAFNAGLVAVVHQSMVHGVSQLLLWAFVALGVGKVVSGYYASILLTEALARLDHGAAPRADRQAAGVSVRAARAHWS